MKEQNANCVHIGDGVYAGFDGYHITLRVNSHLDDPVVFLEPPVMNALISFYNKLLEPLDNQAGQK